MSEATETASAIPKWPVSILDTDLYKARPPCPPTSRDSIPADSGVREQLTMQNAVFKYYPEAEVSYRYTNRNGDTQKLSRRCCDNIRKMIDGTPSFPRLPRARLTSKPADLEGCVLTDAEYDWLEKTCPYFDKAYLDYLRSFRFSPQSQVHLRFTPSPAPTSLHPSSAASTSGPSSSSSEEWGDLEIVIEGKWSATILYEVPILAILSESYFSLVDTTWDYRGQVALAESKGLYLFQAGCAVTDFGTRRRRSYHAQDLVLRGLGSASRTSQKENFPGKLSGTSNVHFAMKYGLAPVGTIAHEMIMATAAMEGYEGSNGKVLDMWEDLYKGQLTIALTDTFSTSTFPALHFFSIRLDQARGAEPFWEDYCSDPARANRWKGLRQDSGDPATFAKTAKSRWISLGIDPKSSRSPSTLASEPSCKMEG